MGSHIAICKSTKKKNKDNNLVKCKPVVNKLLNKVNENKKDIKNQEERLGPVVVVDNKTLKSATKKTEDLSVSTSKNTEINETFKKGTSIHSSRSVSQIPSTFRNVNKYDQTCKNMKKNYHKKLNSDCSLQTCNSVIKEIEDISTVGNESAIESTKIVEKKNSENDNFSELPLSTVKLHQLKFIKNIGIGSYGKVSIVEIQTNHNQSLSRKNSILSIISKDDSELYDDYDNEISSKKRYALKCIDKIHIQKSKCLKHILNEKRILENLDHPFICKFHRTFQDERKIYMLFDFYNGGEMYYHLQKKKVFPEKVVRFYAAQIYIALKYLHGKKIVYRDLKPENIVFDNKGNMKLIDFGLATEIKDGEMCKGFCGTYEYIPPEVIKNKSYSFDFDWWSYGVIIYELLHGKVPFKDVYENDNTLNKIIYDINISNEAKDLISKLLRKSVDNRIKPYDIPEHPFFKSLKFDDVEKLKVNPTFVPRVRNNSEVIYVDYSLLKDNFCKYADYDKKLIKQNNFEEFGEIEQIHKNFITYL